MTKIIALAGRKQSGKTLAANYLSGLGFTVVSFARPIKEMLLLMGVPHSSVYGTDEQKSAIIPHLGRSGRYLAQRLGTEFGRDLVNPNVWSDIAIHTCRHTAGGVVIDDLRFTTELDAVKKAGGLVIGIRRRSRQDSGDIHSSESQIDSMAVDAWIDNDGTVEEFLNDLSRTLSLAHYSRESRCLAVNEAGLEPAVADSKCCFVGQGLGSGGGSLRGDLNDPAAIEEQVAKSQDYALGALEAK